MVWMVWLDNNKCREKEVLQITAVLSTGNRVKLGLKLLPQTRGRFTPSRSAQLKQVMEAPPKGPAHLCLMFQSWSRGGTGQVYDPAFSVQIYSQH